MWLILLLSQCRAKPFNFQQLSFFFSFISAQQIHINMWTQGRNFRPFQVFSVFRTTLACENLTGRQGMKKKKKTRIKGGFYGEILDKKYYFESCLILPSFCSMLCYENMSNLHIMTSGFFLIHFFFRNQPKT